MINRYRSPSVIKKRRKAFYIRLGVLVGVTSCLVAVASYLSHLQTLQVTTISVKGATTTSEQSIQDIISTQTAGAYLYLFSKKNVLLYPKDTIKKQIASTYPQIKGINLNTEGTHEVLVEVTERTPHALWCKDVTSTDECYFMDSDGFIYTKAPYFSGSAFFKYFGGIESDPIHAQFLTSLQITDLEKLVNNLKKISVEVTGMTVDGKGEYIAYLKDGGKILFDEAVGFDKVIENLQVILNNGSIKIADLPKLDYLNMRFGKKVFFKFK